MLLYISALVALTSGVLSDSCTDSPTYPSGSTTAFIPFSNDADYPYPKYDPVLQYHVKTPLSPTEHQFESAMDTGSTGLAISAKDLDLEDADFDGYEKGTEYLSSSRRLWEGYWIPSNLTFKDTGIVASIPILAVTQNSTCLKFANGSCPSQFQVNITRFPTGINYMGIGFGRGSDQQPQALPNKVPFNNITSINGSAVSMHPGYIITKQGIQAGLNTENTNDFKITRLSLRNGSTADDWQMVAISISIDGSGWSDGQALFDTGINYSYVRVDNSTYENLRTEKFHTSTILVPGSVVRVRVGTSADPIATYIVTANDTQNPMNPYLGEFRVEKPSSKGAYINTGRHFYYNFEAMLDTKCGWFGLRHIGLANNFSDAMLGHLEL